MTVALLDYGINNLHSIRRALESLGATVEVQTVFEPRDKLVIPGVGAFGAAMTELAPSVERIREYARGGGPTMGVCLGQQLLFERSEEHGTAVEGLGLVPGAVRYLPRDRGVKVPHMGWTPLTWSRRDGLGDGLADGEAVYFVHSLACEPTDPAVTVATAEHGGAVCAAVQAGSVWGTQFHPEKSGEVGRRILANFLK